MTDVEFLTKLKKYFDEHRNLGEGYFSEEDIEELKNFDKMKYFEIDSSEMEGFESCCRKYLIEKGKDVYSFLARLSFIDDTLFYEKRVILDTIVPFKYDDILFIKYIVRKNGEYSDFFSFIQTFLVFGFDFDFGRQTEIDRIEKLVKKYYSAQKIETKDNYNYIFRKSLNALFYRDKVDIEKEFHDIKNYYSDFNFNSKIMAVFAEKKSFALLRSKYFTVDWISKNNGDGHGFDILVKSNRFSNLRGKLCEVKATTTYPEYMTSLLSSNESEVFLDTLRDDSFYDYIIHVYDMKVNNGSLISPDLPLELFYDRLNHKVYNNFDVPYKIIRNSDGRIGFEDELEKYKTLICIKRD